MTKRILLLLTFILIIVNCPLSIAHCENISDVFTTMPDSIYPLLTAKNRKDMVDFYNNKMEAKVRNRLNDYARLDTLTNQYLHLTPSPSSEVVMRLLETSDSTMLICLVQTVTKPIRDSRVKFYDSQWRQLSSVSLPTPATADFFSNQPLPPMEEDEEDTDSAPLPDREGQGESLLLLAQRSIDDLRLVDIAVSPDEPVFTLTLSVDELAQDEKKVARKYVVPVRYRWTGISFVPCF